jgi:hypothetical protein
MMAFAEFTDQASILQAPGLAVGAAVALRAFVCGVLSRPCSIIAGHTIEFFLLFGRP